MRIIGHLPEEASARVFGDYLFVQGIENQIDHESGGAWSIWVRDEDKLEEAGKLLDVFRKNPADERYRKEAKGAATLRAELAHEQEAYRKKMRDRRQLFRPLTGYGFGPLTLVLIVLSVGVFLLSSGGRNVGPISMLFISEGGASLFAEVRSGQLWRLVTPIFVHFGILHVFFNMLWLRDLGSMIEARESTGKLAVYVLALGVISNSAQYLIAGPAFGGMSGVVYGLLGYIWIRGKLDPGSGLFLHQTTVVMMLVWFVLCFTGVLGSIANYAHAAGLAAGCAWGYLGSLRYR
jgi:GlpG protein